MVDPAANLSLPIDDSRDHVRGPAGAPLALVEYGDFECCGVEGTPTFYVNGLRHDGGYDVETLVAALERGR